jgi:hypothetical protein
MSHTDERIDEIVEDFKDNHAFYTSTERYLAAVDWLRTTLKEAFGGAVEEVNIRQWFMINWFKLFISLAVLYSLLIASILCNLAIKNHRLEAVNQMRLCQYADGGTNGIESCKKAVLKIRNY